MMPGAKKSHKNPLLKTSSDPLKTEVLVYFSFAKVINETKWLINDP